MFGGTFGQQRGRGLREEEGTGDCKSRCKQGDGGVECADSARCKHACGSGYYARKMRKVAVADASDQLSEPKTSPRLVGVPPLFTSTESAPPEMELAEAMISAMPSGVDASAATILRGARRQRKNHIRMKLHSLRDVIFDTNNSRHMRRLVKSLGEALLVAGVRNDVVACSQKNLGDRKADPCKDLPRAQPAE